MRVTDFSESIMRIAPDDYTKLTQYQRDMLRVYSTASGVDVNGDLWFLVASYRVNEIANYQETATQ